MQYALACIVHTKERHSMGRRLCMERLHHVADLGRCDAFDTFFPAGGRHVMIGVRKHLLRSRDAASFGFELREYV